MTLSDRLRNLFRRQPTPDAAPTCSMPTNDEMRAVANAARSDRAELVRILSGFSWGPEVLRQSNVVASEFEEEQRLHRLDHDRGSRATR